MANTRLQQLLEAIPKQKEKGGNLANNKYIEDFLKEIIAALVNTTADAAQDAESDIGAITSYTAHGTGSVPVLSNAATDLDTTTTALATLEDEVTSMRTTVNSLIAKLESAGILLA